MTLLEFTRALNLAGYLTLTVLAAALARRAFPAKRVLWQYTAAVMLVWVLVYVWLAFVGSAHSAVFGILRNVGHWFIFGLLGVWMYSSWKNDG